MTITQEVLISPKSLMSFATYAIIVVTRKCQHPSVNSTQYNTVYDKIFAKGSYFVLRQKFAKFNSANRASYLPGSCGWSSRVAMCKCVCAVTIAQMCQNFQCAKNCWKTFANCMHISSYIYCEPDVCLCVCACVCSYMCVWVCVCVCLLVIA